MRKKTPTPNSVDHAGLAHQYALDVVAKKVPAGKWVRLAAQRHLTDLERKNWKYYFEPEKGAKVCRFIELLPHTKGKWASKKEKVRLQPWQCFLVVVLFGWLKRSTGKRRFQWAYWEIPRKNGKSLLAAGIGLYMFTSDDEFGAEVYSGATTEKQAWEVFGPARLMMKRSEEFAQHLGVEVNAKTMVRYKDGSKFEPVVGKPGDGPSPSLAIVDEYHEHDTPELYDTMETGMGARDQPLLLVVTTAGTNIAGPCHEKHDEVCKVLEGVVENDELFGCIFGIDEGDDWASPASLIKANPNWGVSIDEERLLAMQRQAMQNPIQQNKFKTKHLNVWTSVLSGLMNMQQWKLAEDPLLEIDELAGADCWFADDFASKNDLCTNQILFRKEFHGKPHFYLFGQYWLPEAAIDEPGPNQAHYEKWVKKGLLIETEGATVDFERITGEIIELAKRLNPKEIVYDPFNATQPAQAFMKEGITCVEFIQQPQNFAVPVDELQSAVKDGRFHHDGNEITTWCMSNMVARPAKKGLFSPIKQKEHQKIDGAIAAIMAMSRACLDSKDYFDDFINNPVIG
jgi:phage terminase large subunit-like protein